MSGSGTNQVPLPSFQSEETQPLLVGYWATYWYIDLTCIVIYEYEAVRFSTGHNFLHIIRSMMWHIYGLVL